MICSMMRLSYSLFPIALEICWSQTRHCKMPSWSFLFYEILIDSVTDSID